MNKLKLLLCAMCVMCSGFLFAACEPKLQNFDVNNLIVGETREFVYNKTPQVFSVEYAGVEETVTFSVDNKQTFVPLEELSMVNAGDYKVYFKLSAEGFNDYVSEEFSVKINPIDDATVHIDDVVALASDKIENVNPQYSFNNVVLPGDYVDVQFSIGNKMSGKIETDIAYNKDTAKAGEVYKIHGTSTNKNYNVRVFDGYLKLVDYVQVGEDGSATYYSTLEEAIENVRYENKIYLNQHIEIDKMIEVDKNLTIDGRGIYSIKAKENFEGEDFISEENRYTISSMFKVESSDVTLTLENLVLNGNAQTRAITMLGGNLVMNYATIQNGKKVDTRHSGGVFVSNNAAAQLTNCVMVNNDANLASLKDGYVKFASDLWVGANAIVNVKNGLINSVFVNANSYSATNQGALNVSSDNEELTNIKKVYLEYDPSNSAVMNCEAGKLFKGEIYSSTTDYGVAVKLKANEGVSSYHGGITEFDNTTMSAKMYFNIKFDANIDELLDNESGYPYVFEDCVFNAGVDTNKKVDLTFNNCEFNVGENNTCLSFGKLSNVVVDGCVFNLNSKNATGIDANIHSATCKNIVIKNNQFVTDEEVEGVVSAKIKVRMGNTDHPSSLAGSTIGRITGNVIISGNIFSELNNKVELGTKPTGNDTLANTSTGAFNCIVTNNYIAVKVYEVYKFGANEEIKPVEVEARKTFVK